MSEIMEKAIIALADSPLTTKAVIATGVGSAAGRFAELMPDIISLAGAVVALLAGGALFFKHKMAGKLDSTRREGAEKQNVHDAKMQALQFERMQLELERYKAGDV